MAWPPPTPPVLPVMSVPNTAAGWDAHYDARDRRLREESERVAAHYNALAKQRLEREQAEAKRAREESERAMVESRLCVPETQIRTYW